jgi:uncharacterized protein (DUF1330 family)
MAKAYWIYHGTVSDPAAYDAYRKAVSALLSEQGARFIVRGAPQEVVEGQMRPRTVVIEFPSLAAATACYHSAAYQEVRALRAGIAEADICIIEGWEG